MLESQIENHLRKCCKVRNIFIRKLQWVGRRGAPDNIIAHENEIIFVEVKKPGGDLDPHQRREIERMRDQGARVEVIDSIADVDNLMESL